MAPDAMITVDVCGRIAEWNAAAESMFGWSRAEVIDAPMRGLVPSDELAEFERNWARLASGGVLPSYDADRLHRDGTRTPVSVHAVAVHDDGVFAGSVATFRPHGVDDGSGLLTRRGLQRVLGSPVPEGSVRGVAVLDIDTFALVNVAYGPDVGDEVLREVGRRLGTAAAATGRWQADEFVYVVDAPDAVTVLDAIVGAALQSVREPVLIGDHCLYLTASAGLVTSAVEDGDLFAAASRALSAAKSGGRDRAEWFDAARPASCDLRLTNDLRRGIETGELRVHYQPIVALPGNEIAGVEALVRWQRPGAGLLMPADFVDAAETTGLIVPLGGWVFARACDTAAALVRIPGGPRSVSVNVSARQLADPGIVRMLRDALRESGCDPASLVVEVTETALGPDIERATATLDAIKALGVSLALDDFGTGLSSLLCLKRFPLDRITIDRSFIAGLGVDADDTAIVTSTIALAHSIGITVVAEGVETAAQLALLNGMGCDFAQGYLFSGPLTLGQLQTWLRSRPSSGRRRGLPAVPTAHPETGRILRLAGEGASLLTIAGALNLEGLRTTAGVRWSPQSVAKLLARTRGDAA